MRPKRVSPPSNISFLCFHLAHSQCRQGWREYESKCYFFSTDTKSWPEANAHCMEQNSHLMSIQDIHERLWVRTQIGKEIFWIGLNDLIVEGIWEWSDGKPFIEYLSFWMSGQPDNWNNTEDCGQVVGYNFGHWNDENCAAKRKYICKYINCKEIWKPSSNGLIFYLLPFTEDK
uniref:C-type lectin domain-containing protein n=1 Tax=Fundulus heteroclitus TaxID=8078 RepID=A0A3Q2ST85_FUNHE